MTNSNITVTVQILDKTYQFRCSPHEEERLRQSALLLDAKMREIRDSHQVAGTDRIAVMAAINTCSDFLNQQSQSDQYLKEINTRVNHLSEKISRELTQSEQMEL